MKTDYPCICDDCGEALHDEDAFYYDGACLCESCYEAARDE